MNFTLEIIKSWNETKDVCNPLENIFEWIDDNNRKLEVSINPTDFTYDEGDWYLDEGKGWIRNRNNTFFQIAGLIETNGYTTTEQPVIIQNEIGFLGIICKKIKGILHFLMQCKIEPGNLNKIQISPTIQATKSNFTQKHGGRKPSYLEYFLDKDRYYTVVDQIQSEQSSRFLKKRNRNIVVYVEDEVEVLPSHKWMTLGQIKQLLKYDNIVNMDTRTVLSCLPLSEDNLNMDDMVEIEGLFNDKSLYESIFGQYDSETFKSIYSRINDMKMFSNSSVEIVSLKDLTKWNLEKDEIVCNHSYPFRIIYCNISIEGREVRNWKQPLLASNGIMTVGLFTAVIGGIRKFLVKVKHEVGCFDYAELGPTIQYEYSSVDKMDDIESIFMKKLKDTEGILCDVLLSEEGGRFYHEQNRNVIIEVDPRTIELPVGYYWVDYQLLNKMVQINNCLNIQLRNLLVLIDI